MIKMKVTLTDNENNRRRSKVAKNEVMVISRKLLHSQTSYIFPRYNTRSDIWWHKPFWPWLKVKVTTQGQRSQTWKCLRSLNASCFIFFDFQISIPFFGGFSGVLQYWLVEENYSGDKDTTVSGSASLVVVTSVSRQKESYLNQSQRKGTRRIKIHFL